MTTPLENHERRYVMNDRFFSVRLDERGSAIVIAVLVLAAVTVLGISATNISNTDLLMSNSDIIFKDNLYQAEAAAMDGSQAVENEPITNMEAYTPPWLNPNIINMLNLALWDSDDQNGDDTAETGPYGDTTYAVTNNKVAGGSSLDMSSESRLHEFSVYGHTTAAKGNRFVEIGYKRRY